MKIAIVHDDFIQHGGAEKLVLALLSIYPDATLYTSQVTEDWKKKLKESNIKYKTSFMQYLPAKNKLYKFYAGLGLFQIAFESFNFDDFDAVISVSARFAHGIITKPHTYHISYVNSPPRMFWEFHDYYQNHNFLGNSFLTKLSLIYLKLVSTYFRIFDAVSSQRADCIISNSKTPQSKVQKYYNRNSEIIYPFVNISEFENLKLIKGDFYLVISRLVSWKKIDQAIDACIKTGDKLKVIGGGEELQNYKKKAVGHENIEILGAVTDEIKLELLSKCRALIHTQYEDFGIVPIEAMACGKPVIAYGKGGVLETIKPDITGVFYLEQSVECLVNILNTFDSDKFLMSDCIHQARRFSFDVFKDRIQKLVNSVYLND